MVVANASERLEHIIPASDLYLSGFLQPHISKMCVARGAMRWLDCADETNRGKEKEKEQKAHSTNE